MPVLPRSATCAVALRSAVATAPGLTVAAYARRVGCDRATVANVLSVWEARGDAVASAARQRRWWLAGTPGALARTRQR